MDGMLKINIKIVFFDPKTSKNFKKYKKKILKNLGPDDRIRIKKLMTVIPFIIANFDSLNNEFSHKLLK